MFERERSATLIREIVQLEFALKPFILLEAVPIAAYRLTMSGVLRGRWLFVWLILLSASTGCYGRQYRGSRDLRFVPETGQTEAVLRVPLTGSFSTTSRVTMEIGTVHNGPGGRLVLRILRFEGCSTPPQIFSGGRWHAFATGRRLRDGYEIPLTEAEFQILLTEDDLRFGVCGYSYSLHENSENARERFLRDTRARVAPDTTPVRIRGEATTYYDE